MLRRVWRPGFACELSAILWPFQKGRGDPAYQKDPDGGIWRAIRTPEGAATVHLTSLPADGEIHVSAWGEGAEWAADRLPAMLGAEDDPSGFEPRHAWIAEAWERHRGLRVPRTGLVFESALAAVIEQKVTGGEAYAGWRRLLRRYGEEAPGPGRARGMRVPPAPATVARIPSWEWLRMPVDPGRSRTVVAVARVAGSLERTLGLPSQEADRRLRSLPGVGRWTSAEVRQRAHGDPDAVSLGDYHLGRRVGWTLLGEVLDDDAVEEFLEPYRPHRFRVQQLVDVAGSSPPRRGPRMAPRRHLPT
ncbi:MAG: DNA-3-methyladenine glycosylase 2 family protein [Propionibacteriales bacterium]|nr:DNA-3-methyladenine glycosylase 2 family protein [Propionibacteriales bacterium]